MSKLARLHRKIGFSVAVFLGLFVCSGILLHHTEKLNLDSSYVSSALILDYYGFDQAPSAQSIRAFAPNQSSILVQIDDKVYLNRQSIFNFHGNAEKIVAATDMLQHMAFATQQQIYVFDQTGEFFDVLDTPYPVLNMGFIDGKLTIKGDSEYSALDDNFLTWKSTRPTLHSSTLPWSQPLVLQHDQIVEIWQQHRSSLLSWSRVIQDVHSGQIGGWIGNLIADVAAIALLLLAISGLSMGRREKENDHQPKTPK